MPALLEITMVMQALIRKLAVATSTSLSPRTWLTHPLLAVILPRLQGRINVSLCHYTRLVLL